MPFINTNIPKIVPALDELQRYIDVWLTACKSNGIARRTAQEYEAILTKFHWWYTDYTGKAGRLGIHPGAIGTNEIRSFITYLREPQPQGRWGVPLAENASGGTSGTKEELAFSTVKNYYTVVRVFFNFLEEEGAIEKSPFTKAIKLTSSKKHTVKTVKTVSEDDLVKIFASLTDPRKRETYVGSRNLAIISFMLDTGVRRGEVLSVLWQDMKVLQNRCAVRGKTGERVVFFSANTRKAINDYLSLWRDDQGKIPDWEFWRTSDNQPLSYAAVGQIIKKVERESGVDFHAHSLRTTFATMMASSGINVFDLKELMGHSSITTTQIYVQTNPEKLAAAYRDKSPMANINMNEQGRRRRGRPRLGN